MLVLNLQGSFCTLPRVPAAGEPCAAGHFHLTAPLHLLLPPDPTVLTGSAKGGREIAFCNWIFSHIWPKSDYIWSSAVTTGLFDLSMYVKINSTHPHPTPPQYILSYLCIRNLFHIFSAERIRFFCLCHNRLILVLDAGKHIPPSTPCTPCT